MPLSTPSPFRFAAVLLIAVAALLAACGEAPTDDSEPVVQSYTVRGIVQALPDAGRPGTELYVHHEAIPEFVNDRGESVGMDSMAMPFPVADPSLLDGIAIGDRVMMRFEVEWDGSPPLRVVALDPLPDGTVLAFEETSPAPAGEAGPDDDDAGPDDDEAGTTEHDEHG